MNGRNKTKCKYIITNDLILLSLANYRYSLIHTNLTLMSSIKFVCVYGTIFNAAILVDTNIYGVDKTVVSHRRDTGMTRELSLCPSGKVSLSFLNIAGLGLFRRVQALVGPVALLMDD